MKKKILIILIALIGVAGIIIASSNVITKKNNQLEIKEQDISKMFAIKVNDGDGSGYKDYTENAWPEGYVLDNSKTSCEDFKGNALTNVTITYDKDNNKVKVNSNKTAYCYLYFVKNNVPTCTIKAGAYPFQVYMEVNEHADSWYFEKTNTIEEKDSIEYVKDESKLTSNGLSSGYYHGYVKNESTGLTGSCTLYMYQANVIPCAVTESSKTDSTVTGYAIPETCKALIFVNPDPLTHTPYFEKGTVEVSLREAIVAVAIKNNHTVCPYLDRTTEETLSDSKCREALVTGVTVFNWGGPDHPGYGREDNAYISCEFKHTCSNGLTYTSESDCLATETIENKCQDGTTCDNEGCCETHHCSESCQDGFSQIAPAPTARFCYQTVNN